MSDPAPDPDSAPLGTLPDDAVIRETEQLLKGFASATRLRILCLIGDGEVCVHQIVDRLDLSQSAISHQLRTLRNARLVTSRRDGRHVHYRLADDHVRRMLTDALDHGREGG